jgi:hypothetical protein
MRLCSAARANPEVRLLGASPPSPAAQIMIMKAFWRYCAKKPSQRKSLHDHGSTSEDAKEKRGSQPFTRPGVNGIRRPLVAAKRMGAMSCLPGKGYPQAMVKLVQKRNV